MITKFVKNALKHWFKHTSAKNLLSIEIYEVVRITLARNFKTVAKLHIGGIALHEASKLDSALA